MTSQLTITAHLKESGPEVEALLFDNTSTDKISFLQRVLKYLGALAGGLKIGHVRVNLEAGASSDRASQTIVCDNGSISNGDTLTIGGVVLTVAASPANESEWTEGADSDASAVALAACINAHSELKGYLIASVVDATVTVTFWAPGRLGNLITLATSDASAFTLGGAVLAGGDGSQQMTARSFEYGMTA